MRSGCTLILAISMAVTLVGYVGATSLQQAYAPRGCGTCGVFLKVTATFEKAVINSISDPEISPQLQVVQQFLKLAAQWKIDVINTIQIGDSGKVPGLLETYKQNMLRIFLGGSDTIPGLVEDYSQQILRNTH